jgi:hypothetical protein
MIVRKGTKETARYIELYGSAYRLALKHISTPSETRAAELSFVASCFYPASN